MYTQQYGAGPGMQAGIDAEFLFLKQLNAKELQDLIDDTDRLNGMVDDLNIVKNQQMEKDTQLTTNKSIAEFNLSREQRLIDQRQQLAVTYEQAAGVKAVVEQKRQMLGALCPASQSLDTTLALLQTEAAKSDEESEACAESFLAGQTDSDEFIRRYIDLRTLAHVRKVKVEKMSEILREQEQARSHAAAAAVRTTPLPPFNGFPAGAGWGSAPYPINPSLGGYPMMNNAAVYQ